MVGAKARAFCIIKGVLQISFFFRYIVEDKKLLSGRRNVVPLQKYLRLSKALMSKFGVSISGRGEGQISAI